MAKLSVYKTIDRSQLGGKFVPLIQSGVSNYKILASDLGKEYHPGDAIDITDTGEINVKFNSNDFELFNSSLSVKTDDARGVFNGGNGIYIKSADNTINVSYGGVKVNTGYGLFATSNGLCVKHANNTIGVSSHGISVYYGSGLTEDRNTGALIVSDTYVRHNFINKLAGQGLYSYIIGYHDSALGVKSADDSIVVSEYGIRVHARAFIGDYLSADSNHNITVDTASVARAITGSGLVTTNGAIGVNANTATGIIVNDNKLYLNAGNGLQTTNNTVNVKAADNTINVSYSGVSVNKSALSIPTAPSLAGLGLGTSDGMQLDVKVADNTIDISEYGIKVNRSAMPTAYSLAGNGLVANGDRLYVKPAGHTISVHSDGVGIRLKPDCYLYKHSKGLAFDSGTLFYYLQSGSGLTSNSNSYVDVHIGSGLSFSSSGAIDVVNGHGLRVHNGGLSVKSADHSILVGHSGIKVNSNSIAGHGLRADMSGNNKIHINTGSGLDVSNDLLYVRPADNTITVGQDGIKVNKSALSIPTASSLVGSGLTSRGSYLYVQSADGSIGVGVDGIKVNAASGLETTSSGLYVKSADNTITVGSDGIKVNTLEPLVGLGLEWSGAQALYVKSADSTIEVSDSGIRVNPAALAHTLPGKGLYSDNGKISIHVDTAGLGITDSGSIYWNKPDPGWGLESGESGTYYVKSADGTIGVSSSGIGVNVTSGGGLLTGTDGLYIDSGKIAGRGLTAHTEQHNVKLNVNVGLYDLSSNNNSSNLLKINTATNELYVSGVDVTGIIGTNNTMTREQDSSSYYHRFGVDVNYLFSVYTDRSTLIYNGNSLGVHLASIAGEGLGYNPESKSLYTSSGGSIIGVSVNTPNQYEAVAVEGGVAIGESAHATSGNGTAVGRLSNAHGTQSVAIGYFASAVSLKSIAIGDSAKSTYDNAVAIGASAEAHTSGVSIGYGSRTGIGVVVGSSSYTQSGVAVGVGANAEGYDSIAVGSGTYIASGSLGGVAVGAYSHAVGQNSVAVGYKANASNYYSLALGGLSAASAMSVCSGYKSSASGEYTVAVGSWSSALNQYDLSAGYKSIASGEMSVAVGTHSISSGYGCLSLGAFSNSSASGVAVGYKANSSGGIAIGYASSAEDGMLNLSVYSSSGRSFGYNYGYDGNLYATDTSGSNYLRSWENLLTPPDYTTAVSINANTEYTANRPAYIVFNVYAGGTGSYTVAFIKNGNALFEIGVLYGLTIYNIIPVSKGETYKLQVTNNGATNPAIYAYRIYPK